MAHIKSHGGPSQWAWLRLCVVYNSLCVFVFQTVEQAYRQIQNIVDFSSNVMSSLLGEKFIHSGVSSHLRSLCLCLKVQNVRIVSFILLDIERVNLASHSYNIIRVTMKKKGWSILLFHTFLFLDTIWCLYHPECNSLDRIFCVICFSKHLQIYFTSKLIVWSLNPADTDSSDIIWGNLSHDSLKPQNT